ncbi:MAG: phosphotransferase, partial [Patescibacteria group bacterium]
QKNILLQEYIEGTAEFNISLNQAATIARIMAQMHNEVSDFKPSASRNWPGTLIQLVDNYIEQFENKSKPTTTKTIKNFDTLLHLIKSYKEQIVNIKLDCLDQGAIHGDIKIDNIKFKDNKLVGLLDFDDCRYSYFLEDIVNSLLLDFSDEKKSILGKDNVNLGVFLDSYNKIKKLSPEEKKAFSVFCLARLIKSIFKDYFRLDTDKKKYTKRIEKNLQAIEANQEFLSTDIYIG